MIHINLLSPNKKRLLKDYKTIYILRLISYILIVYVMIIAVSLYLTQFFLEKKLSDIELEISQAITTLPTGQEISPSKIVKEANQKIMMLKEVQGDYVKWSAYLVDFNKLVPGNVSLGHLSITQENNVIKISGFAKLRDDFLSFKANLDNSSLVKEIDSPVSNLLKKEDVNFTITAKMVLDKHKLQ